MTSAMKSTSIAQNSKVRSSLQGTIGLSAPAIETCCRTLATDKICSLRSLLAYKSARTWPIKKSPSSAWPAHPRKTVSVTSRISYLSCHNHYPSGLVKLGLQTHLKMFRLKKSTCRGETKESRSLIVKIILAPSRSRLGPLATVKATRLSRLSSKKFRKISNSPTIMTRQQQRSSLRCPFLRIFPVGPHLRET